MLCKVKSLTFYGLELIPVDVEVGISGSGLPSFDIVGLPNKSIEESKHRVRSAIRQSGLTFPNKKITVNLAPADIHKEGSFYDLAVAVGILCANEDIIIDNKLLFFGELSLDGSIRHTKGTLNAAVFAQTNNFAGMVISEKSKEVSFYCPKLKVYCFENLLQLYKHLSGSLIQFPTKLSNKDKPGGRTPQLNSHLDDIVGQNSVKKLLGIAVAGGHHTLLMGPPGVGKTALVNSIPSILPKLSNNEILEVAKIYSYAGNRLNENPFLLYPPFRNPHHSTTYIGMIGGGSIPNPGEITLAHLGILFMDEFCEFPRQVIEVLRQPLESGYISLTRANYKVRFPAKFTLIAASNPCKCGYKGSPQNKCNCTEREIHTYLGKLSGPFCDRLDLICYVQKTPDLLNTVTNKPENLTVVSLRECIDRARNVQKQRFMGSSISYNREIPFNLLDKFAPISSSLNRLVEQASSTYSLSSRSCHKIIKVARTLADMEGSKEITEGHILESIQYKCEGSF